MSEYAYPVLTGEKSPVICHAPEQLHDFIVTLWIKNRRDPGSSERFAAQMTCRRCLVRIDAKTGEVIE